jgi:hypothetical protein
MIMRSVSSFKRVQGLEQAKSLCLGGALSAHNNTEAIKPAVRRMGEDLPGFGHDARGGGSTRPSLDQIDVPGDSAVRSSGTGSEFRNSESLAGVYGEPSDSRSVERERMCCCTPDSLRQLSWLPVVLH